MYDVGLLAMASDVVQGLVFGIVVLILANIVRRYFGY